MAIPMTEMSQKMERARRIWRQKYFLLSTKASHLLSRWQQHHQRQYYASSQYSSLSLLPHSIAPTRRFSLRLFPCSKKRSVCTSILSDTFPSSQIYPTPSHSRCGDGLFIDIPSIDLMLYYVPRAFFGGWQHSSYLSQILLYHKRCSDLWMGQLSPVSCH